MKIIKKRKKSPQNYKSPTQSQWFITTIKNVTEKKKNLRNLIRFPSASKIDSYIRGELKTRNKKGKNI